MRAVFAYGPTGTGKTYTMLGSETRPGLMVHALQDVFTEMHRISADVAFKVSMTYVEVG